MHNELIKVFNGEPISIEMINDTEFYVDVTGMSHKYRKMSFSNWKKLESTKDYILGLREELGGIDTSFLIKTEAGSGTKIHNSLLIEYARWANVKFAIWCNNLVFDILTGKKQLQLENQTKMLKEVENKYAKQISDLKCEVNKKTQHKLITYADQTQSLRKWIGDKFPEYEISERELWKFLAKHPDGFMRVIPATKTSNVIVNMDYGKNVGDSIAFNDAIIPYIQEFIGDTDLTKKPQQGKFEF